MKNVYVCSVCSSVFPKWQGQCMSCQAWNTLTETISQKETRSTKSSKSYTPKILEKLSDVDIKKGFRNSSGISELDRVLGGGFVKGHVLLLAGEPGIGKSTLLLQVAEKLPSVYISGEESSKQIASRASRLGVKGDDIFILNETNVDSILSTLDQSLGEIMGKKGKGDKKIPLVILDSIQTLYTPDLLGMSGSVGQMRECAFRVTQFAKKTGVPIVMVGHVTKEGEIAGPKVLEHIVDTVCYLEGDKNHLFRILKSMKNRFGSVDEVGVFEMDEKGMKEVKNPSTYFVGDRLASVSGSVVTISMEGSRPFAVDVQALTARTSFGYPKRTASGLSISRVQILCAVLEKRLNLKVSDFDVYVNIVGGLKLSDTASDLAICLAIYSGIKDINISSKIAAFGEVGLTGEIRKVPHLDKRVKEAKRLGYDKVISPKNVKNLSDAVRLLR